MPDDGGLEERSIGVRRGRHDSPREGIGDERSTALLIEPQQWDRYVGPSAAGPFQKLLANDAASNLR